MGANLTTLTTSSNILRLDMYGYSHKIKWYSLYIATFLARILYVKIWQFYKLTYNGFRNQVKIDQVLGLDEFV